MDSLLCEHGQLAFDPEEYWVDFEDTENQVFRIADEDTYQNLSKYYELDQRKATTDMSPCKSCLTKLKEQKETEDLWFQNETLKVNYKAKIERQTRKRTTKNSTNNAGMIFIRILHF